jgi:DNA-binding Lrp family transcriptional regulator
MLTKNDLKLLSAMEEDGRLSYAELSRKTGISIPTVTRRVKALYKNKTFTINAVPNPYKLGYRAQAVIAMNVPFDKVNGVCDRLKENYNINLIVTTFGRFDLLIAVYYAAWDELHDFISNELNTSGDILEVEAYFVKDTVKRFYGFSRDDAGQQALSRIDETDQRIMEELSRNGRQSNLYLSRELGISVSAVSRRVSNLLNEGLIQIQAIVDPDKLGYGVNAFVLIKARHEKIEEICRRLSLQGEVISVMKLVNSYDIFISLVSQNHASLYGLIQKIVRSTDGITSIETLIRGEIIKRYYGNYRYGNLNNGLNAQGM